MTPRKSTRDLVTGEQLTKHRGERTQEQLAEEWFTPVATIQGWERNRRRIPGIVKRVIDLEKKR